MKKILIVEDVEMNRDLLVQLLEDDYELVEAADGREGLASVKSETPDLVLLDISLPEMDGYEVCRRLKADAQTASIPVVFVTADARDDVAAAVREAGGVGVLSKPYAQADLLEMVRANLR